MHARFEIKQTDDEARTFTGLAATWDLDLGGDVIRRGAFKETLSEIEKADRIVPLLDTHGHRSSITSILGKMEEAKETKDGLLATFSVIDDPIGEAAFARIKGGFVDGLSIGYEAKEVEFPTPEQRRQNPRLYRTLKKVSLREVSVVLFPMNESARIQDVKQLLAEVDQDGLGDDEYKDLRRLATAIGHLLSSQPKPTGEDPHDPPKAKEEEDEDVPRKAEDPKDPPAKPGSDSKDSPPADPPKADDPESFQFSEALQLRIGGVLRTQTRLAITGKQTEE